MSDLLEDLTSEERVVDGEPLRVLDAAAVRQLAERVPAQGAPEADLDRWLRGTATRVATHPGFALAWHHVGAHRMRLWLVLWQSPERCVRIHWEDLICPHCQARCLAANPTIPELHWGAPDERLAREAAWQVPVVPCPRCGGRFDRRAIWAELEPTAP